MSNIKNTDLQDVECRGLQGSILGSLLFLIYVNNMQYALNLLDPIMLANDTDFFLKKI